MVAHRIGRWGVLGMLLAGSAMAAGIETVYQRTGTAGAITLTNLPTGVGEQVLVTGGAAGTAARAGGDGSNGTVADDAMPSPNAPRTVAVPPSIEVRSGKLLDAEAAARLAQVQARDAQAEILAAGGAQARLRTLYEASMTAFQARSKAP